jgi:hypothetical protein
MMMSTRTTLRSVQFNKSFRLNGVDSALPAGTYLVETDEENIAEFSFPTYRRVRTTITVPINKAHTQVWQVFTIDPQDLEDALSRDLSGAKEGKGEYFD